MANPKYIEEFSYIGPHNLDRNKLMRDYEFDSTNNYQQSDVVTILTNLGSIPDYTARKFHLQRNFAVDFMGFMDEYKKDFEENNGVRWEYSNEKLEHRYITFKRTRESFQNDLRKGTYENMGTIKGGGSDNGDGEAAEGGSMIEMKRFNKRRR